MNLMKPTIQIDNPSQYQYQGLNICEAKFLLALIL